MCWLVCAGITSGVKSDECSGVGTAGNERDEPERRLDSGCSGYVGSSGGVVGWNEPDDRLLCVGEGNIVSI